MRGGLPREVVSRGSSTVGIFWVEGGSEGLQKEKPSSLEHIIIKATVSFRF